MRAYKTSEILTLKYNNAWLYLVIRSQSCIRDNSDGSLRDVGCRERRTILQITLLECRIANILFFACRLQLGCDLGLLFLCQHHRVRVERDGWVCVAGYGCR